MLDKVRNGQIGVDGALTQLLLESQDQMKALLAVARGEASHAPNSAVLTERIKAFISGQGAAMTAEAEVASATPIEEEDDGWGVFGSLPRRYRLHLAPGPDTLRQGANPALLLERLADAAEILSITCDTSSLPPLSEMDPETSYLAWNVDLRSDWEQSALLEIFDFLADDGEVILTALDAAAAPALALVSDAPESVPAPAFSPAAPIQEAPAAVPVRSAPATPAPETQTLRVSADKVDKLINLVGELVINQSMLNEVVQDFSMAKLPRLIEAVAEMERASRELQERVMAVRMLPIKHAFGRFPRLVRDLATAVGKKIELKTSGEETELDKGVIEAIAAP